MISTDPLIWWTFIILIFGWSYLWKETDLFHFVEYSIIAVSVAHAFNSGLWFLIDNGLTPILQGQLIYIVGFILGFLMYFRFWRRYAWVMRWSLGLMAGTYIGLSIRGIVQASIIAQIIASIKPLGGLSPAALINQIILLVMVVSVSWYFIFSERLALSRGKTNIYKYVQILGRVGIITVMAFYLATDYLREANYIFSRLEFVIRDLLGMIV
jgi:hypothetical protein